MKKLRGALCLLLAAAMALSLAACGGQDEKKTPENTPTPEYVYAAEYSVIDNETDSALSPALFVDGGYYATISEKIGEKEIPEGVTPEYEGEYDIYGYAIYFVSYDGTAARLENYKPLGAKENSEGYSHFDSSSYISGMVEGSDGNLVLLENVYASWYDGPGDVEEYSDEYWQYYKNTSEYYIRIIDKTGAELSSALIDIEGIDTENGYLSMYNVLADKDGNLLFTYDNGSGEYYLLAFGPDGSQAYSVKFDNYIDQPVLIGSGQIGVTYYGNNGLELQLIDSEAGKPGEKYSLPNDAWDLIPGDTSYDFYYTSGVNLMGYKLESGESAQILNWISCDVNSDNLSRVHIGPDGTITGVINNYEQDGDNSNAYRVTTELVTLKKVPYDSVPHKESLTMAVVYLDYNMRDMIIKFNRNNDKFRIDVKDYSQYNTDEDYEAGITKLNTEIMAGNMPDLLCLSQLPYTQLAAKGLLEDIYPMLDADSELSREDFFANVLAAQEVNGGLYQVCPSFSIITVIGAKSVVGDTPGWTYADFEAALAKMPEGCDPFDYYTTKANILSYCLAMDMDSFIDWSTGKCSFDSQDFVDLLNFANRFQAEFDWDSYDFTEEDSQTERIASGRQMLMNTSVYSIDDAQYNELYFGGPGSITYIGYPTNSGVGNALSLSNGYAISSTCKNKEAAWEFLRTLLTENYQKQQYQLPMNRKVFEDKLEKAMTPRYRTDAEGNFILDENGEKIKESNGGISFGNGVSYELYEMSQEQADALMYLVENTTRVYESNEKILEIVQAEAEAFFSGQKSAEEVAKLIQSKVNIYVNEQL